MIIYEDKNILAINKPAGLLVHPTGNSKSEARNPKQKTLTDWLKKNKPKIKAIGDEPKLRPGIVHRLDKDTSGVLIIAKSHTAYEFLKKQFKNREVKKTYIALVKGKMKNKKGLIDTPIKRFTKSRDAITEYKVIQTIKHSVSNSYTLLEIYPKTGRTHQIRIHLKSIGYPIVCENLYTKKPDCPFGLKRHFLHAYSLELTLPDGGRIKLEADLPEDLQSTLKKLKEYGRR